MLPTPFRLDCRDQSSCHFGTIRRERLDHVSVLGARHLRRIVRQYISCYQRTRSHLALHHDAPEPCAVQSPEAGDVLEIPEVGGSITDTREAWHSPSRYAWNLQNLQMTQHCCAIAPSTPSMNLPRRRLPQGTRRVPRRSLETDTHQDPLIAIRPSFGDRRSLVR